MPNSRKNEDRVLDTEEREMVVATRHPEIQQLSDADLSSLISRVRDRRDRAQTLARQRRREMRGKALPRGAEPSREDGGSRQKADTLAAAMRRLNGESQRRRAMRARMTLMANAQRALASVQEAEQAHETFNSRTARDGMRNTDNRRSRRIGSPMEAGRVNQFVKTAQAKKDAR